MQEVTDMGAERRSDMYVGEDEQLGIPTVMLGCGWRITVHWAIDNSRTYEVRDYDELPPRHRRAVSTLLVACNEEGDADIDDIGCMYNRDGNLGPTVTLYHWLGDDDGGGGKSDESKTGTAVE